LSKANPAPASLATRNLDDVDFIHDKLWRYLTFEKFVSLLELSAVWFSRLGALQDEFEGTLPEKARDRMLERDRKFEEMIPDPRLKELMRTMTDTDVASGRAMMAVNCWYLDENDHELMWEQYDPEGKGLAVTSTVQRLSSSFELPQDYRQLTWIGRVDYVDFETYDIEVNKATDVVTRALLKQRKFIFEKEIRIITLNSLHPGCFNPDGSVVSDFQLTGPGLFDPERKGFYLQCLLPNLIQSITLNPKRPSHSKNLIARLLNRYQLYLPIHD
jgi:hypothetical protein